MSDRLEKIKQRNEDCRLDTEEVLKSGDLEWLISELEKCRAAIKYWESSAQRMATEVEKLKKRGTELETRRDELFRVLKYYEEKAQAVARYMKNNNVNALEACMVELSLDGGAKARVAQLME